MGHSIRTWEMQLQLQEKEWEKVRKWSKGL